MERNPLSDPDLRHIEEALDEGETEEAASRLARLAEGRAHDSAVDFLTTRLLYQRGRIDLSGASERVAQILARRADFHEARSWLDTLTPELPRFGETDDDVTPAEPRAALPGESGGGHDSPQQSPRTNAASNSRPSARPSRLPFDSLGAKEQLERTAGRYRASRPPSPLAESTRPRSPDPERPPDDLESIESSIEAAFERAREGDFFGAHELLPRESSPAGLSHESRSTLSRLLLELGEPERAAAEARQALEAEPESREAQLLFAWCAVRYARQRGDDWSLKQAGELLKKIGPGPTPEAGLLQALHACVEARVGNVSVAGAIAMRALRVNAESIDALAAMVEAATLTDDTDRAAAALDQLSALSESAAERTTARLRRLGVSDPPSSSASIWLPVENESQVGARDAVREAVEALALASSKPFSIEQWPRASVLGAEAASFFAHAPVLRHFGCYDRSLDSLARVEAALGMLYGHAARPATWTRGARALWQLAGFYLGETLVASCGGHWLEAPAELLDGRVLVLEREVTPFQLVRSRMAHGQHARLPAALAPIVGLAQAPARAFHDGSAPQPLPPWGPQPWPNADLLPRLGRALGHSVVSSYCAECLGTVLDLRIASLSALDGYLDLVTPTGSGLDQHSNWARWLSGFVGGYLGEVACRELGARWRNAEGDGPERAVLELANREVAPVAWVLDSITGARQPMNALLNQLRAT